MQFKLEQSKKWLTFEDLIGVQQKRGDENIVSCERFQWNSMQTMDFLAD